MDRSTLRFILGALVVSLTMPLWGGAFFWTIFWMLHWVSTWPWP